MQEPKLSKRHAAELAGHLVAVRAPGRLAARQGHGLEGGAHPLKRSTRHAEQPQADFMVLEKPGGWYVRFAMREYGPYPKARAVAGAIKTAKLAEKSGKTARVREELEPFRFKVLWPRPARRNQ